MTYTTRVDGMAKEGHWVLRPRTRVWPMHSAARLVPLSNTGVPVTETVVDGTRTEAVYKITARIPTSDPCPSTPRCVNHSLDDLKQALGSAENGGRAGVQGRTEAKSRNEAFVPRTLGVDPSPVRGIKSSAISGRCVWRKRDGTKREGEAASLGPWR